MPTPGPSRTRQRPRQRARATERRARSFALVVALGVVLVVALLLTAFGRTGPRALQTVSATLGPLTGHARPSPEIVARKGPLRLQLPIAQKLVTAIGYHAAGDGAIALDPVGPQGNQGLFQRVAHKLFGGGAPGHVWYQLPGDAGPPTSALDVGATPGTDVYAPADGTIVGITPYVVNGDRIHYGVRVDIQPQAAPAFVVTLTHVRLDPGLTVGSPVMAGVSKLGKVVDLSSVEKQALARFTTDAGNHVSIEVRPAAALSLSLN